MVSSGLTSSLIRLPFISVSGVLTSIFRFFPSNSLCNSAIRSLDIAAFSASGSDSNFLFVPAILLSISFLHVFSSPIGFRPTLSRITSSYSLTDSLNPSLIQCP